MHHESAAAVAERQDRRGRRPACSSSSPPAWFLLVSPQRSKATDLETQLDGVAGELLQRRPALAQPSASVTVKPSDLYRLTKALPDETDMAGILLDVNRLAGRNELDVQRRSRPPPTDARDRLRHAAR